MTRGGMLIAGLSLFQVSLLAQAPAPAPRSGFTVLTNLGVGVQNDTFLESTKVGLAGANLGLGGFLTSDLAIMFRFSGTTVIHDLRFSGDIPQLSGVVGGTVQFWPRDRFFMEFGGGTGFWMTEDETREIGPGLIIGASGVVWKRGGHSLLVGGEYAPAFTESGTVHNLGFTFGYQFHRY